MHASHGGDMPLLACNHSGNNSGDGHEADEKVVHLNVVPQ